MKFVYWRDDDYAWAEFYDGPQKYTIKRQLYKGEVKSGVFFVICERPDNGEYGMVAFATDKEEKTCPTKRLRKIWKSLVNGWEFEDVSDINKNIQEET